MLMPRCGLQEVAGLKGTVDSSVIPSAKKAELKTSLQALQVRQRGGVPTACHRGSHIPTCMDALYCLRVAAAEPEGGPLAVLQTRKRGSAL